jgi:hypothetical protein
VSSRNPCLHPFTSCVRPDCFINVYTDGVQSSVRQPDFARMSTIDYAIAEFYPGSATVPPEYAGVNPVCGVLLLWTRER